MTGVVDFIHFSVVVVIVDASDIGGCDAFLGGSEGILCVEKVLALNSMGLFCVWLEVTGRRVSVGRFVPIELVHLVLV